MSVNVQYTQRVPNEIGKFPREDRTLSLGADAGPSIILIEIEGNPDSPGEVDVRIDSNHAPQDFADAMLTTLHAMSGELDGSTATHRLLHAVEVGDLQEAEPTGNEPALVGEVVEHPEN